MSSDIKFTRMLKDPVRATRFFLHIGYSRTSVAEYLNRQLGLPAGEAARLVERMQQEKDAMDEESRTLLDRAAVESEHDLDINPLREAFNAADEDA